MTSTTLTAESGEAQNFELALCLLREDISLARSRTHAPQEREQSDDFDYSLLLLDDEIKRALGQVISVAAVETLLLAEHNNLKAAIAVQEVEEGRKLQVLYDDVFARRMAGESNRIRHSSGDQSSREVPTLVYLAIQACLAGGINVCETLCAGGVKIPKQRLSIQVGHVLGEGVEENKDDGVEEMKASKPDSDTDRDQGTGALAVFIDKCNSCFELERPGAKHSCGHGQCEDCLRQMFVLSLTDTSLLPPKCCRLPIDLNYAAKLLDSEQHRRFLFLMREITTLNKFYCPQPSCSSFLDMDQLEVGTEGSQMYPCPLCGTRLCLSCRTLEHAEMTCEEVQRRMGPDEVLEIAEKNGWRQCTRCHHMIELHSGCNHITCICKHEFCYLCAETWKTCTCQRWDEHRLYDNARLHVLRAERRPEGQGGNREAHIQARMRELILHDDCEHWWSYKKPPRADECMNCGFFLYVYCYECQAGCAHVVCFRCRFHRM